MGVVKIYTHASRTFFYSFSEYSSLAMLQTIRCQTKFCKCYKQYAIKQMMNSNLTSVIDHKK